MVRPVLGVMVAQISPPRSNAEPDGLRLTAGLQSLDEAECERWMDQIRAGNLYVNRGTTGAIVNRQPFGGWRRSSVGPTAKAGGHHYVNSLRRWIPLTNATTSLEMVDQWWRSTGSQASTEPGSASRRTSSDIVVTPSRSPFASTPRSMKRSERSSTPSRARWRRRHLQRARTGRHGSRSVDRNDIRARRARRGNRSGAMALE